MTILRLLDGSRSLSGIRLAGLVLGLLADQGIDRIAKTLEDARQTGSALVCYLHDNGRCAEPIGHGGIGPARAKPPTLPPLPADSIGVTVRQKQTRDGHPIREGKGVWSEPATRLSYSASGTSANHIPTVPGGGTAAGSEVARSPDIISLHMTLLQET